MEKNKEYLRVDIEIIRFDLPDVLTTSGYGDSKEDDDGWTPITDWS